MLNVENKINNLKQKLKPLETNQTLQGDYVMKYLKDIHKRYALVVIDWITKKHSNYL